MEILNYHEAIKGSKLGHFQVCINSWREIVIDMTLFQKGSHRWISFPTTKYEKDGKVLYKPMVKFKNPATHKAFETKVLELLDKYIADQQKKPVYQQADIFATESLI